VKRKYLIISFLFLVFFSQVYSSGFVENQQKFYYYSNIEDPTIELSMLNLKEDYALDHVLIDVYLANGQLIESYNSSQKISLKKNIYETLKFKLSDFNNNNSNTSLSEYYLNNSPVHFDFRFSPGDISFSGASSPSSFYLKYDTVKPTVIDSGVLVIPSSKRYSFSFSKPLSSLKILDEKGTLLYQKSVSFPNSFNSFFEKLLVQFPSEIQGHKTLTFEMIDLAGNVNSETRQAQFQSGPLTITLLTNQDDSSLTYYFEKNNPLFSSTIYTSSSDSMVLQLETSKQAKCYFSQVSTGADISGFSFEELTKEKYSPVELQSSDNLIHSISISLPSPINSFWIGCKNIFDETETKWLSEELDLGKQIIVIKKITGDFSMDVVYPNGPLSTTNEFKVKTNTNQDADCFVKFGSQREIQLKNTNNSFKTFEKLVSLANGKYNPTKVYCYDQLHRKDEKSFNFEVNPDKGIQIVLSDDLYYVNGVVFSKTSSLTIPFTTSSTTHSCRFTIDGDIGGNDYEEYSNTANPISEGKNIHDFSLTSLQKGKMQKVYIYCYDPEKITVSKKAFNVLYDDSPPVLSNLYFVNDGFLSEKYISSVREITVEFNVSSPIPIKEFKVFLKGKNGTSEEKQFDVRSYDFSKPYSLSYKENNEEYSSIVIRGTNIFDIQSNILDVPFQLDITGPVVGFQRVGKNWKITCKDDETGCKKAFYGLGPSKEECLASHVFDIDDKNASINAQGYAVICARALNGVGISSLIASQETGFVPLEDSSEVPFDIKDNPFEEENETSGENSSDMGDSQPSTSEPEEEPEPVTPSIPNEEESSSSSTPLILGAILFVVASLGGGGYYAYKKGYLNDQLRALGVKIPEKTSSSFYSGSSNSGFTSSKTGLNSTSTATNTTTTKKSKYDLHLKRLNSFLDSALEKDSEVFDSFKESQKGRVKNYKDSMAHPKGFDETDETDEFYQASRLSSNIKKEGEEFEEYYKNKKNASNNDKNSSKKK
jgi:hypothetical protein